MSDVNGSSAARAPTPLAVNMQATGYANYQQMICICFATSIVSSHARALAKRCASSVTVTRIRYV